MFEKFVHKENVIVFVDSILAKSQEAFGKGMISKDTLKIK